jgi:hypothetical protein
LQWLITIPADGSLPLGGAAPALIEWQTPVHPASGLQDVGCSLQRFEVFHPEPDRIGALLAASAWPRPLSSRRCPPVPPRASSRRSATPSGLRTIGA